MRFKTPITPIWGKPNTLSKSIGGRRDHWTVESPLWACRPHVVKKMSSLGLLVSWPLGLWVSCTVPDSFAAEPLQGGVCALHMLRLSCRRSHGRHWYTLGIEIWGIPNNSQKALPTSRLISIVLKHEMCALFFNPLFGGNDTAVSNCRSKTKTGKNKQKINAAKAQWRFHTIKYKELQKTLIAYPWMFFCYTNNRIFLFWWRGVWGGGRFSQSSNPIQHLWLLWYILFQ